MRERLALAGCWWKTDGGENKPIVYLFLDEEKGWRLGMEGTWVLVVPSWLWNL